MLLGRFLPIVFVLGLAGSLARQQPVPASAGTLPHLPAAVRRHARRRHRHRRRADLPPGSRARPARGGSALMTAPRPSPRRRAAAGRRPRSRTPRRAAACSTRRSCWRSLPDALRKLDPRTLWRNPVMFIVEIGAVFTTVLAIADPTVFAWLIVGLALAHRAVRQPRRGGRRGPRQGPGRHAAPGQDRHHRPPADRLDAGRAPTLAEEPVPAPRAAAGRRRRGRGRARSSPATATSSRASPASTSRPSPASPRR